MNAPRAAEATALMVTQEPYYRAVRGEVELIEAKRAGIHPFCITIDSEARACLPRMYGAVNYTVVADVARLPLKVAEVYRRLTA